MERDILTTIDETLEKYIYELKDKPARLYDAIVSCGEDFNAQLIAAYNNSQGIPTKYISPKDAGILVTDLPKQAQILDSAYEQIYKLNNYKEKLIIPGFFGVSKHHFIVTFLEVAQILRVLSLLEVLEHRYMKTLQMYLVYSKLTPTLLKILKSSKKLLIEKCENFHTPVLVYFMMRRYNLYIKTASL